MERPKCRCGNLLVLYKKPNGRTYWSKRCQTCIRARARYQSRKGKSYQDYKKDRCALCGFVALHKCQLDVDHIDGDGTNHDPSNLQTLCANCHRLKTQMNREHVKRGMKDYLQNQLRLFDES